MYGSLRKALKPAPTQQAPQLAICPHCGRIFAPVAGGACPHCGYPLTAVLDRGRVAVGKKTPPAPAAPSP